MEQQAERAEVPPRVWGSGVSGSSSEQLYLGLAVMSAERRLESGM